MEKLISKENVFSFCWVKFCVSLRIDEELSRLLMAEKLSGRAFNAHNFSRSLTQCTAVWWVIIIPLTHPFVQLVLMCHRDESYELHVSLELVSHIHLILPTSRESYRYRQQVMLSRFSDKLRAQNTREVVSSVCNWPSPERVKCAKFWWLWDFLRWRSLHRLEVRRGKVKSGW